MRVFQDIADGKEITLPNFGQEILHHIHGHDIARVFFKAITHKNQASGKTFDAERCDHTCHHIARSDVSSIEKTKLLPEYPPKYICIETTDMAVKSHVDSGLKPFQIIRNTG